MKQEIWCSRQIIYTNNKLCCTAHLHEGRVFECNYNSAEEVESQFCRCPDYIPTCKSKEGESVEVKAPDPDVRKITFEITNCKDCMNFYTDAILTADSFEHETGAYCRATPNPSTRYFGENGKHKMIAADEWDVRRYTDIPSWCPLLPENKEKPLDFAAQYRLQQEKLYETYKNDYLQSFIRDMNSKSLGDSPLSFDEWKKQHGL